MPGQRRLFSAGWGWVYCCATMMNGPGRPGLVLQVFALILAFAALGADEIVVLDSDTRYGTGLGWITLDRWFYWFRPVAAGVADDFAGGDVDDLLGDIGAVVADAFE